jgi:hypothetical protein
MFAPHLFDAAGLFFIPGKLRALLQLLGSLAPVLRGLRQRP